MRIVFLVIALLASGVVMSEETKEEFLKVGDTGSYIELSQKPNPENLTFLYIPGISALLARAEELKGSSLSESEIERIRKKASVVATPQEVARKTIEDRGYE